MLLNRDSALVNLTLLLLFAHDGFDHPLEAFGESCSLNSWTGCDGKLSSVQVLDLKSLQNLAGVQSGLQVLFVGEDEHRDVCKGVVLG